MEQPRKTCRKCERGFTGEGNLCKPCRTGEPRKKSNLLNLTKTKLEVEDRMETKEIIGVTQDTVNINKNLRLSQEPNQAETKSADEEVDEIINWC